MRFVKLASIVLFFAQLPTITMNPPLVKGNEGEEVRISCSAVGIPTPKISWDTEYLQSEFYEKFIDNNEGKRSIELLVKNISGSDNGWLNCIAENVVGQVKAKANIQINSPPLIQELRIKETFHLCITYIVTGYPTPNRTWLFNDRPLNLTSNVRDFPRSDTPGKVYGCLEIRNPTHAHTGNFTLISSNENGKSTRSVNLEIDKSRIGDGNIHEFSTFSADVNLRMMAKELRDTRLMSRIGDGNLHEFSTFSADINLRMMAKELSDTGLMSRIRDGNIHEFSTFKRLRDLGVDTILEYFPYAQDQSDDIMAPPVSGYQPFPGKPDQLAENEEINDRKELQDSISIVAVISISIAAFVVMTVFIAGIVFWRKRKASRQAENHAGCGYFHRHGGNSQESALLQGRQISPNRFLQNPTYTSSRTNQIPDKTLTCLEQRDNKKLNAHQQGIIVIDITNFKIYVILTYFLVIQKVTDGSLLPRPEKCPEEVYELMVGCWNKAPSLRIDMKSINARFKNLISKSPIYLELTP
ncbi:BDNF/NT-3 growth factors receptor [Nymphon striatum]|nr:BDNF/NT-3 growth factors receptor [Nymphon striatum]